MNITMLGATGRVGSIFIAKTIEDGHTVKALVRYSNKTLHDANSVKSIIGDALNPGDIDQVMTDSNMVFCALSSAGNSTLSKCMPIIIESMKKHHIKRIVTIGTAGILQARYEHDLFRFQSSESRNRSTKATEDHLKAYLLLKESGLDWTVVCPTYLPDGECVGSYRFEKDYLPENGRSISTCDTAEFAYRQLFSDEFLHCRVGLAY
ncbi:NAD(P)-dependent oxidoreductase [Bacillus marasmi]|uniref:NAD(P)-dependent oxidoreductase n=1 Tax=Bacillus marasmi TaxID=1926279 RepID=UPI0011C9967A|nr:NAD(P)H-binding protein [Bacillus marasmi]